VTTAGISLAAVFFAFFGSDNNVPASAPSPTYYATPIVNQRTTTPAAAAAVSSPPAAVTAVVKSEPEKPPTRSAFDNVMLKLQEPRVEVNVEEPVTEETTTSVSFSKEKPSESTKPTRDSTLVVVTKAAAKEVTGAATKSS
jgi:hypothetical protein